MGSDGEQHAGRDLVDGRFMLLAGRCLNSISVDKAINRMRMNDHRAGLKQGLLKRIRRGQLFNQGRANLVRLVLLDCRRAGGIRGRRRQDLPRLCPAIKWEKPQQCRRDNATSPVISNPFLYI